jgi:hypothetical protein
MLRPLPSSTAIYRARMLDDVPALAATAGQSLYIDAI